jgi:hypothetical protein
MTKSALAKKITAALIVLSVLSVILATSFMLLITRQQFADYIRAMIRRPWTNGCPL